MAKTSKMKNALKKYANKLGYDEFKNEDDMWGFLSNTSRLDPPRKYTYYGPNAHAIFKDDEREKYYHVIFGETGEPKYYKQISKEDAENILIIAKRLSELDSGVS